MNFQTGTSRPGSLPLSGPAGSETEARGEGRHPGPVVPVPTPVAPVESDFVKDTVERRALTQDRVCTYERDHQAIVALPQGRQHRMRTHRVA